MPLSPFGVGGWTAASAADLLELSSIVSALFNRFAHSAGPGVEGSWSWGVRLSWKSVAHRSTAKQREAQRSIEKHREAHMGLLNFVHHCNDVGLLKPFHYFCDCSEYWFHLSHMYSSSVEYKTAIEISDFS